MRSKKLICPFPSHRSKRPSSVYGLVGDARKVSSADSGVAAAAVSAAVGPDKLAHLTPADFEAGRAEALGALCRLVAAITRFFLLFSTFTLYFLLSYILPCSL